MINAVGSPAMVFGVWIFGGILTLFGALTYAELSAAMPDAGGEYVYLNAAYGPFFGFIYGWTQTWVAKAASIATLPRHFSPISAIFFPVSTPCSTPCLCRSDRDGEPLEIRYGQLLGIGVILFLAGVNYLGVRVGGGVQIAVTALKLALIAGLNRRRFALQPWKHREFPRVDAGGSRRHPRIFRRSGGRFVGLRRLE